MGYLACPVCDNIEFANVVELQHHIACALTKSLSCPICSATLKGLHAMHVHLGNHIPMNSYEEIVKPTIPSSPEQYPAIERLEIHDDPYSPRETSQGPPSVGLSEKGEKNGSTFNCNLCGLVFASDHFLTLHKDLVHVHASAYEVTCKQCKSRFKSLELYRDHVREKHSERRYICDQCPKSFKWKGGLVVHNRMCHDLNSPTTCIGCKKKFNTKYRKEIHEKKCHAVKKAQLEKSRVLTPSSSDCMSYIDSTDTTLMSNLLNQSNNFSTTSICSPNCEFLEDKSSTVINNTKSLSIDQPIAISQSQDKFFGHQKLECSVPSSPVLAQTLNPENASPISFIAKQGTDVEMVEANETDRHDESFTPESLVEGQSSSPFSLTTDSPQQSPQSQLNFDLSSQRKTDLSSEALFESQEIPSFCNRINQKNIILQNLKALSNMEYDDFLKATLQSSISSKANLSFNYIPLLMENKHLEETKNEVLSSPVPPIDFLKHIHLPNDTSVLQAEIDRNLMPPVLDGNTSSDSRAVDVIHKMEETIGKLSYENKNVNDTGKVAQKSEDTSTNVTVAPSLCNYSSISKSTGKKSHFSGRSSGTKSWECDECKKCFTTKYFLKKHKRLHTGETPYSCEECGKTYTFQQSFHKHLFYHSSDKPHICPHCGRAFKEMSTLHNHIRIHTGEKPFTCNTCGKAFRQRVSFLVHQRIHTGQMPYHCDECNRSFRYKVSLRSHKCDKKSGQQCDKGDEANLREIQGSTINDSGSENELNDTKKEMKKGTDLHFQIRKDVASLNADLIKRQSSDGLLTIGMPNLSPIELDKINKKTQAEEGYLGEVGVYVRNKLDEKRITLDDKSNSEVNATSSSNSPNIQQFLSEESYQRTVSESISIPENLNDINTSKLVDFSPKIDPLTDGSYPSNHELIPDFESSPSTVFDSSFLPKLHSFSFDAKPQIPSKSLKNHKDLIVNFTLPYDQDIQCPSTLSNKSLHPFSAPDLSPTHFTPMNLDDDIDNDVFLKSLFNE